MALTVEDLDGVRAQWGEWVDVEQFALSIEVLVDRVDASLGDAARPGGVMARVASDSRYCHLQIRRGDQLVFDQRCPYDADALRASVAVLARTIAEYDGP